jgi:hypothetical protein
VPFMKLTSDERDWKAPDSVFYSLGQFSGTKPFIGLLKNTHCGSYIKRTLFKSVGIPLAARRRKKITAINMDRRGDFFERIRDRMYD